MVVSIPTLPPTLPGEVWPSEFSFCVLSLFFYSQVYLVLVKAGSRRMHRLFLRGYHSQTVCPC